MAADAYVTKCLKTKLKTELMSLGGILGIPIRKSWTKGRMIGLIAGRYEENPEILFYLLSRESADFLRKHLRNPKLGAGIKDPIYKELEFLGLVEKMKFSVENRKRPVEKKEDALSVFPEFLFEGSVARTSLLEKRQAGLIRRLDEMEKVVRGMLRSFGLMEEVDLIDMAARTCLRRYGERGLEGLSGIEEHRYHLERLLRCRLGFRSFIRTYEEGNRRFLLHPLVADPARLRYSILASPVKDYRAFTFEELVSLGEREETSGAAYSGLLELLRKHPFKEEGKISNSLRDDGLDHGTPNGGQAEDEGSAEMPLKQEMQERKTWEEEILQIKLRIREGALNLEIVREVMERLHFEDHQEVSDFLERFISHCDDIPRWNLKGYRMNEI